MAFTNAFYYTVSMRHSIKICFSLMLCLLLSSGGLFAQKPKVPVVKPATDVTRSFRLGNLKVTPGTYWGNVVINRALQKRVDTTFRKIYKRIKEEIPEAFVENWMQDLVITQGAKHPIIADPKDLYPEVTFLETPEQLTNYFLARNNRIVHQEYKQLLDRFEALKDNLPALQKSLISIEQSPEKDIEWLANYIPQDLDYLLIGEQHNSPEIQRAIKDFIPLFKRRFHERDIILFTEFLQNELLWKESFTDKIDAKEYTDIWNKATSNFIPVIGMEADYSLDAGSSPLLSVPTGETFLGKEVCNSSCLPWQTPEGLRLRNKYFLKIIQRYRKDFPNALFIIYTGAGHVEYDRISSLSRAFPADKTFEVSLYPQYVQLDKQAKAIRSRFAEHETTPDGKTYIINRFDALTLGKFPSRVYTLQDPSLRELVGFDVQIKIPPEE